MAVLFFRLIMEGTHPFDGIFVGNGDVPDYDARIASGHFTYSRKRKVPYSIGPRPPPFEILHPDVQELFVRCFEQGHDLPVARPDASVWESALKQFETALTQCKQNREHFFGIHLKRCPWCERKGTRGYDPFPSVSSVKKGGHTLGKTPSPQVPLQSPANAVPPTQAARPVAPPSAKRFGWLKIVAVCSLAIIILRAFLSPPTIPLSGKNTTGSSPFGMPAGFTIPASTLSPDRRYGVLVPDWEHLDNAGKPQNQLTEVATGKVLATINGVTWVEGGGRVMNHGSLTARWSPDGSVLSWIVGGKWFPRTFALLKIRNGAVVWQLDVLTTVQKEVLARAKAAAPANYAAAMERNRGSGSAFPDGFTIDVIPPEGGVSLPLRCKVTLTANPKRIEDLPAQAELDASMDATINSDGRVTFSDFAIQARRSTETAPGAAIEFERTARQLREQALRGGLNPTPSPAVAGVLRGERYPQTRLRNLQPEELRVFTSEELQYAINEMYARRGMDFRDKMARQVFARFDWYQPRNGSSFKETEALFSPVESGNLKLLGHFRDARRTGVDPAVNLPPLAFGGSAVPMPSIQTTPPSVNTPRGARYAGKGRVYKVPELKTLVGRKLENAWLYGDFLLEETQGTTGYFITTAILLLPKEGSTRVQIEFPGGIELSRATINAIRDPVLVVPVKFSAQDPLELLSVTRNEDNRLLVKARSWGALRR